MCKYLLAVVLLTSGVSARRSQLHNDLEKSETVGAEGALASFMFAQQPLVSISSRVPVRAPTSRMEGQEELRNRIASTEKSKKITKTMKLVAAARARKAGLAAQEGRLYMEKLRQVAGSLSERLAFEDTSEMPLLEMRPTKKVALIVITGDRGLCGGYNAKILKKTNIRIKELTDLGIETEIHSIGNKGTQSLSKLEKTVSQNPCGNAPTSEDSQKIIKDVIARFLEGEVDRVELIYTSFTSMVSSTPSIRTIIPFTVSKDGIEMEDDEIKMITSKDGDLSVESAKKKKGDEPQYETEMVLEQSPNDLINSIMPMYLNGGLLSAWRNAVAAELGSRYTAMQAATDNAEELQNQLELQLNRMRQAAITAEISEIVAGSSV